MKFSCNLALLCWFCVFLLMLLQEPEEFLFPLSSLILKYILFFFIINHKLESVVLVIYNHIYVCVYIHLYLSCKGTKDNKFWHNFKCEGCMKFKLLKTYGSNVSSACAYMLKTKRVREWGKSLPLWPLCLVIGSKLKLWGSYMVMYFKTSRCLLFWRHFVFRGRKTQKASSSGS